MLGIIAGGIFLFSNMNKTNLSDSTTGGSNGGNVPPPDNTSPTVPTNDSHPNPNSPTNQQTIKNISPPPSLSTPGVFISPNTGKIYVQNPITIAPGGFSRGGVGYNPLF